METTTITTNQDFLKEFIAQRTRFVGRNIDLRLNNGEGITIEHEGKSYTAAIQLMHQKDHLSSNFATWMNASLKPVNHEGQTIRIHIDFSSYLQKTFYSMSVFDHDHHHQPCIDIRSMNQLLNAQELDSQKVDTFLTKRDKENKFNENEIAIVRNFVRATYKLGGSVDTYGDENLDMESQKYLLVNLVLSELKPSMPVTIHNQ